MKFQELILYPVSQIRVTILPRFPRGVNARESACPSRQETRVQSLGGEDPLEKEMATHSSILTQEFHGQRNLAGYSPWGHKESDAIERLSTAHSCRSMSLCTSRGLSHRQNRVHHPGKSTFYQVTFKRLFFSGS